MSKIRTFEIKKGLYITPENYEDFTKTFETAISKNLDRFPFRNKEGKVYAIETAYVEFVMKTLQTMDHEDLIKKSEDYKKTEEQLTKEEFEDKQKGYLKDYQDDEKQRDLKPKIYDLDGQVINKKKNK
jgi:hypothetical protein